MRWVRWWYLWFLSQTPKGTTTVTSEQIVYHQRVRMLAHAVETGNIAETCRVFGVSTKTFHKWRNVAAKYGLEALWPKKKRAPVGGCERSAGWAPSASQESMATMLRRPR